MEPIQLPNGRRIGPGEQPFVVAEIGQNHNGDVYTATRLLKAAHDAGVDAVKFCKRHIPSDLTRAARDAPYPGPQSFGATYGEHREALELSIDEYAHLKERMEYNEWPEVFFSTVCDLHSLEELERVIDPPLYKIASRDLWNEPLLDAVARTGKPVILSTGMKLMRSGLLLPLGSIRRYHNQIIVLYCVSHYPTPDREIELVRIRELEECGVLAGYSDHTSGITMCQAAAAMGAVVIEKHITLARAMKGTDHACSLEPHGMAKMTRNVKATWQACSQRSTCCPDTLETWRKLGRSLVASHDMPAGYIITAADLVLKSPGTGIGWQNRDQIIGGRATVNIPADTMMRRDMVDSAKEFNHSVCYEDTTKEPAHVPA